MCQARLSLHIHPAIFLEFLYVCEIDLVWVYEYLFLGTPVYGCACVYISMWRPESDARFSVTPHLLCPDKVSPLSPQCAESALLDHHIVLGTPISILFGWDVKWASSQA